MSKSSDKFEQVTRAAEHIKRVCPNDIAGQMVLAAFAQDAIDHEGGEPQDLCNGCYEDPCECLPDDCDCDPN